MKKLFVTYGLPLLVMVLALGYIVPKLWAQLAQGGPIALVQQTATRLDAATAIQTANTTGGVLTFGAQNGQVFYLTEVEYSNCASASAVTASAVSTITSANLGGLAYQVGSGTTAGGCVQDLTKVYNPPLKSAQANTATTFTLPTFYTNQTIRMTAQGYYAPY